MSITSHPSCPPVVDEAFRVFDRWRADHDPDGEMDILDAATAYAAWAETNSIVPYLDANQGAGR